MMRRLWQLLVKEYLQLVRTPALLFVLVLCPVVTIGFVPFGLNDKARIRVAVVDESFSDRGREAVALLARSPQIVEVSASVSRQEGERRMDKGEVDALVVIPPDGGECRILADASQIILGVNAALYTERQLTGEQGDDRVRMHWLYLSDAGNTQYYLVTMLVLLIAIIGCCLVALFVVQEKESKVLEHLRSTGLSATMYVLPKVLFVSLLGLCELAAGLVIARVMFSLECAGSLPELFLLAACFLFAIVNLGILIAVGTRTLVRTIYVLVFVFIILILLSTMFAPLDNMDPVWASTRYVNPFFWAVDGGWKIILKGIPLSASPANCLALLGTGGVLMLINILKIKQID